MIESYKKFLKGFHKDDGIPFNCPECEKNTLYLDQDSWFQKERVSSILEREHIDIFEAEWVKYSYTGTFQCLNPKCREIVITSGSGSVIEEYTDYCLDKDGYPTPCESEYRDIFFPKYFYPTLNFFNIPEKTPEDIRIAITDAFSLTPNSPSAAANKIRVAVEILATEFEIPSKKADGGFVTLDQRIRSIQAQENELYEHKDLMLAIKYIGNAGSHEEDNVSFDELFDSFQIIEDLLKRIYQEKSMIDEMVKVITSSKAPMSREQRKSIRTNR
ncbi:DUF4145 domain-containing protein [Acinetobacter sp. YH12219]|uniref:DUF4145 domain-containing protein n=1 Tax=Acinetobacter sp. YH12219 TaxID=2601153 RepID=UPI0015D2DB1C|nr:DUF4145 domain-containing protein [Acinetobacter sp. YH12219]